MTLQEQVQIDLKIAMRARDQVAVPALRSLLAALGNAEAVDGNTAPVGDSESVAGAVVGLGAADVARRTLTDADVQQVVTAEIDERMAAADLLRRSGAADRADRLTAEAGVLLRYRT